MTAELELRWADGSLDLMGWNSGDRGDFWIDALADGTDWGNPESVRRKLRRFLPDGSSSVKEYDDNRTIPLSLRVTAPDGVSLAGGEQALDLIDGRRCELVWTPPDSFAPPALFKVDFADLRHRMDDLAETRTSPQRFYGLTLECLPHAYSVEWVEVPAVPQDVATPVLVDDCASLSGWIAYGPTITDAGDFIQVNGASGTVRRNGVVDLTGDRYLAVEYDGVRPAQVKVSPTTSGSFVTVPQVGLDGPFVLYDVGLAIDAIDFTYPANPQDNDAATPGSIRTINKQSGMRTSASNGQVRTVAVPGSRRTPATLTLDAGEGELDTAIVYSGPDYDPSLVNRLAPGSPAHFVSDAQPVLRYVMPASDLPSGHYVVWGALSGGGSGAVLDITAELLDGSTMVAEADLASLRPPQGTDGWSGSEVRPLFAAELPGFGLPDGSELNFGLRVTKTAGGTVSVPWLWLFNITSGTTPTVVECGSNSRLWLEPPSLTKDHPTILSGSTTMARAMPLSLSTQVLSWSGASTLTPPVSTIYTWSSASAPEASARFRPAHHTHPTS